MHMKILKFRTFKEDLCRLLFRYSFDLFQRPSRTRDWLVNIIHHLKTQAVVRVRHGLNRVVSSIRH